MSESANIIRFRTRKPRWVQAYVNDFVGPYREGTYPWIVANCPKQALLLLAGRLALNGWKFDDEAFRQDNDWNIRRAIMNKGHATVRYNPVEHKWIAGWYLRDEHFYGEGWHAVDALAVLALRAMEPKQGGK
jgi:hypothetical protein